MRRKDVLRIIDELKARNALILAVWDCNSKYPRLWLKDWCGARTSVSIGTAERILEDIRSGRIHPRKSRPRRRPRRLPEGSREIILTYFVN